FPLKGKPAGSPAERIRLRRSSEAGDPAGQRALSATSFPVAMAEGSHLFPFRTQALRPPAALVLRARPRGSVARCREAFRGPKGPLFSWLGPLSWHGGSRRWAAGDGREPSGGGSVARQLRAREAAVWGGGGCGQGWCSWGWRSPWGAPTATGRRP